jgi:hypothetical protein
MESGWKSGNRNTPDLPYNSQSVGSRTYGISPEERWQAIAVMAYDLAKTRGFAGESSEYWLAAEASVDAELAIQQSAI